MMCIHKTMKRLLAVMLTVCMAVLLLCAPPARAAEAPKASYLSDQVSGWPVGPEITPEAGILVDIDSGTILYGKNMHDPHYPASITKVMTALVACENGDPNQVLTFSHDAVYSIERGSANVGMKEGEQITLDQALRCLMAASANDCAYGIAEGVGGTHDAFIDMMNAKAKELGCVDSHFANPHGLHDPDHYVSAYDMGRIASAAYKNSYFRELCHIHTYNRPLSNMNPNDPWVITHRHQMFRSTPYYYEYCTGGKTGFTNEAKSTLVTFAEKDGMRLACVVLAGNGVEVYVATRALFEFGFTNFRHADPIECAGEDMIDEVGSGTVTVPVSLDLSKVNAMGVLEGGDLGTVSFSYGGNPLGEAKVAFTEEYVESIRPRPAEPEPEEPEPEEEIVEQEETVEEEPKADYFAEFLSILSRIPRMWQIIGASAFGVLVLLVIPLGARLHRKRKQNSAVANREKDETAAHSKEKDNEEAGSKENDDSEANNKADEPSEREEHS